MSEEYTQSTPVSESGLVEQLLERPANQPIQTSLRTDARVIARVTDGIYRQPGSAIRELISNAYDADATNVTIQTDRPRFRRMVIEDDGIGMSPPALAHLLYHIGGSAKRTSSGVDLGITNRADPTRSPGGRPLIGKIGIGLFSVAQLTQGFEIITKIAGDDKRTVASVLLKQYSERPTLDSDSEYEAGRVLVWREPAADVASHGTTIVLDAIRPQTRETLRSTDIWDAVYGSQVRGGDLGSSRVKPPAYHIGTVKPAAEDLMQTGAGRPSLPWVSTDENTTAFRKLVDAVWDTSSHGGRNPRLEQLFDYYLRMVWELGLWCPLPYVDFHPFNATSADNLRAFVLEKDLRERELELKCDQTVRDAAHLGDQVQSTSGFSVTVDDLHLCRPIRLKNLPATSGAVKTPLLFVASHTEEFPGVDVELSGGELTFQAYILWAPKVVPTDHQGVLIRAHDATGTLFDPTFLRFPLSEQRRLTQMTCEIFITRGFDGAINIDRESFNFAHPHVVALTKWLHSALRRVIAVEKRIASSALQERRAAGAKRTENRADEIVVDLWNEQKNDDGTVAPSVVFTDNPSSTRLPEDSYVFPRGWVVGDISGPHTTQRREAVEGRLEKIVQILAVYDLLDPLTERERADLLRAIRQVLEAYDE